MIAMNSSAFVPLAVLLNHFSGAASANVTTAGFANARLVTSAGGGSTCITGNVQVPINVTGTDIHYSPPKDQLAVTESFVELFQVDSTFAASVISGPSTISGSYSIFAKLCVSSEAAATANVKTVQLLTHGATLDHTYWDIAPGYSYVDVASAAGYATLSYDQLGVGNSDHPDPIQVVQAAAQVAITHHLVGLLRASNLGSFEFENVVGVGHSAGSTLTQGITTQHPKDFDAVILSGTSTSADSVALTVAAFNFVNANTDPAPKLKALPAGYLTQASAEGIQFAFYRYPNFDINAFHQQVANKQTNTLGLLLTLGGLVAPSTEFTGPIDVVNGQNDLVFCGGDCLYPQDQNDAVLTVFYPAAPSGSQTYIASGSGHAIAAHKSGPDSFDQMIQFLQANGL